MNDNATHAVPVSWTLSYKETPILQNGNNVLGILFCLPIWSLLQYEYY